MEHELKHHSASSGFLNQFTPKAAFIFGIVSTAAVFSLAALVVILPLAYRGSSAGSGEVAGAAVDNTAPSAPPAGNTATVGDFRAVSNDEHVRGNKNAKVTIIEYSDLECPFCKRHHPVMKQLFEAYNDDVRWVYRHFPLDSLHPKARKEAEASECANELGGNEAFWKYIDLVYEKTPANNGLDLNDLPVFAEQIGLSKDKFQKCLDSGKYAKKVADDLADATTAGAQGTPHSLIVDAKGDATPLSGALPYDSFKQAIDALL